MHIELVLPHLLYQTKICRAAPQIEICLKATPLRKWKKVPQTGVEHITYCLRGDSAAGLNVIQYEKRTLLQQMVTSGA